MFLGSGYYLKITQGLDSLSPHPPPIIHSSFYPPVPLFLSSRRKEDVHSEVTLVTFDSV